MKSILNINEFVPEVGINNMVGIERNCKHKKKNDQGKGKQGITEEYLPLPVHALWYHGCAGLESAPTGPPRPVFTPFSPLRLLFYWYTVRMWVLSGLAEQVRPLGTNENGGFLPIPGRKTTIFLFFSIFPIFIFVISQKFSKYPVSKPGKAVYHKPLHGAMKAFVA
jgi:hypothetical protein